MSANPFPRPVSTPNLSAVARRPTRRKNLLFSCVRRNKNGRPKQRFFQIRFDDLELVSFNLKVRTKQVYKIDSMRCLEKSSRNKRRLVISFFDDTERSIDLLFDSASERDRFCTAFRSLDHKITIETSSSRGRPWVPDSKVRACMRCGSEFTVTNRRHHCRYCGDVVCGPCSPAKALLPRQGYTKPERVCDDCLQRIRDSRVKESLKSQVPIAERSRKALRTQPAIMVNKDESEFSESIEDEKRRKRWNTYLVMHTKISYSSEVKQLCRIGIPPELRGDIWQILSGSKAKQSRSTPNYYRELLRTAEATSSPFVIEIEKDLHRTFSMANVTHTEKDIDILRRVLIAYSVHNARVGYCQSMNFICALLLLFMEEEAAFWMLSVIVEEITCVEGRSFYYQSDLKGVHVDDMVFTDLVAEKLPKIAAHMRELKVPLSPISVNWFLCLFINSLPLETTLRIWDILFYEKIKSIFRAGLAFLKINQKLILASANFEQLICNLKDGAENCADPDAFIKMCFDKMWIGSLSMAKIRKLRLLRGNTVDRELRRIQRAQRRRSRNASLRANAAGSSSPTASATEEAPSPKRQRMSVAEAEAAKSVSPESSLFLAAKRLSLSHSHSTPQIAVGAPARMSPEKSSESSVSAGRSTNDSEVNTPLFSAVVPRRFSSFGNPTKRLSMSLEGRPRTVSIESVGSSDASVISVSDLGVPGEPRTSATHRHALRKNAKHVLEPLEEAAEEEPTSPVAGPKVNGESKKFPQDSFEELDGRAKVSVANGGKLDEQKESSAAKAPTSITPMTKLILPHVASEPDLASVMRDTPPPAAVRTSLPTSFSAPVSPHIASNGEEATDSGAEAPPTSSPEVSPPTSTHGGQVLTKSKQASASLAEKLESALSPLESSQSSPAVLSKKNIDFANAQNPPTARLPRPSAVSPSSTSSSSTDVGGVYTRERADAQLDQQLREGLPQNTHNDADSSGSPLANANDSKAAEDANPVAPTPRRTRGVTFGRDSLIQDRSGASSSQVEREQEQDQAATDSDAIVPLHSKFESHFLKSHYTASHSPIPLLHRSHSLHRRRTYAQASARDAGEGDTPYGALSKTRSLTSTDIYHRENDPSLRRHLDPRFSDRFSSLATYVGSLKALDLDVIDNYVGLPSAPNSRAGTPDVDLDLLLGTPDPNFPPVNSSSPSDAPSGQQPPRAAEALLPELIRRVMVPLPVLDFERLGSGVRRSPKKTQRVTGFNLAKSANAREESAIKSNGKALGEEELEYSRQSKPSASSSDEKSPRAHSNSTSHTDAAASGSSPLPAALPKPSPRRRSLLGQNLAFFRVRSPSFSDDQPLRLSASGVRPQNAKPLDVEEARVRASSSPAQTINESPLSEKLSASREGLAAQVNIDNLLVPGVPIESDDEFDELFVTNPLPLLPHCPSDAIFSSDSDEEESDLNVDVPGGAIDARMRARSEALMAKPTSASSPTPRASSSSQSTPRRASQRPSTSCSDNPLAPTQPSSPTVGTSSNENVAVIPLPQSSAKSLSDRPASSSATPAPSLVSSPLVSSTRSPSSSPPAMSMTAPLTIDTAASSTSPTAAVVASPFSSPLARSPRHQQQRVLTPVLTADENPLLASSSPALLIREEHFGDSPTRPEHVKQVSHVLGAPLLRTFEDDPDFPESDGMSLAQAPPISSQFSLQSHYAIFDKPSDPQVPTIAPLVSYSTLPSLSSPDTSTTGAHTPSKKPRPPSFMSFLKAVLPGKKKTSPTPTPDGSSASLWPWPERPPDSGERQAQQRVSPYAAQESGWTPTKSLAHRGTKRHRGVGAGGRAHGRHSSRKRVDHAEFLRNQPAHLASTPALGGAQKRYHQVNGIHSRPKAASSRGLPPRKSRRTNHGGHSRRRHGGGGGGRTDSMHTADGITRADSDRSVLSSTLVPAARSSSRSVDITSSLRASSSSIIAPAYKTNGDTSVTGEHAITRSDSGSKRQSDSTLQARRLSGRRASIRDTISSLVAGGSQQQQPPSSDRPLLELELSARNLADVETFQPPPPITPPPSRSRRGRRSNTNPWDALTKGSAAAAMYSSTASPTAASAPRTSSPIVGEYDRRSRIGTMSTIETHEGSYVSNDEYGRRPSLVSARYSPLRMLSFDFPGDVDPQAQLVDEKGTQPNSFMSGSVVLNAARNFAYALFGKTSSLTAPSPQRTRAESVPSYSSASAHSKASGSLLEARRSSLDVSEFGFPRDTDASHRYATLPPTLEFGEEDEDDDENFDNDGGSVCKDDDGRSFERQGSRTALGKERGSVGSDHGFFGVQGSLRDRKSPTAKVSPRNGASRVTSPPRSRSPSPDPRSRSPRSLSPPLSSRSPIFRSSQQPSSAADAINASAAVDVDAAAIDASVTEPPATFSTATDSSTTLSGSLPNKTHAEKSAAPAATTTALSRSLANKTHTETPSASASEKPAAPATTTEAPSATAPASATAASATSKNGDIRRESDSSATKTKSIAIKRRRRANTASRPPPRVSTSFSPSVGSFHAHSHGGSPSTALSSNIYLFPSP